MKNILIFGGAGFIGYHLCVKFLDKKNYKIHIVDNINDYYETSLKLNRLKLLKHRALIYKIDISNKRSLENFFKDKKFDTIFILSAQAGLRYSYEDPDSYIKSNINGLFNIYECLRKKKWKKNIYFASSSSIYSDESPIPFSDENKKLNFKSLYPITKLFGEDLSRYYSLNYNFEITVLRFFTVYGPYGRPDMAYFSFLKSILENKTINLVSKGNLLRDFTYIDDLIEGILKIYLKNQNKKHSFLILNLGNNQPRKVIDIIRIYKKLSNKKVIIKNTQNFYHENKITYANIDEMKNNYSWTPKTTLEVGLKKFYDWYVDYYEEK